MSSGRRRVARLVTYRAMCGTLMRWWRVPRWRLWIGRVCGISALSGLLGCGLGDKLNPALDVPSEYRAGRNAVVGPAEQVDAWRAFRSQELTALTEQALTANFDIAVAVARILEADAQVRVAGAALLPTIGGSTSVTRSQTPPTVGGFGTLNVNAAALNASYMVDVWGRNRALLRAAERTASASRFDRAVIALSTVAAVADTYFLVLEAQDRLRTAKRNVVRTEQILKLVEDRREQGAASSLDVAQQASVVAIQRAMIPVLVEQRDQNRAALALLVGRPPERLEVRGGSLFNLGIPQVAPGLPSALLARRPDIHEAEEQLAAADGHVEAARAAFFPTIQLTGQTGASSVALATLFGPGTAMYSMAGSLTQPIFDGGQLLGQLELESATRKELLEAYRKAVVSAFTDVDKALVAVQEATMQEGLQRVAVEQTKLAFDLSEDRLRFGAIDLTTLLTTEQNFFQQEDLLAQVRRTRVDSIVGLFQALGGGWLGRPAEAPKVQKQAQPSEQSKDAKQ
jgi:NodT family efflux transporter outer membrane factor (OMF) lipoprotein